jgi:Transposase IS116/IS110/IS902 family
VGLHRVQGVLRRSIGAYLGLVPSENSSGERRRQGAITKTGNAHARRLLVEAAWHQRRPISRPSRELARRHEGQPALVRVRAEAAGRLVLELGDDGRLKAQAPGRRGERARAASARSMRDEAVSSPFGPRSTLEQRRSRRRDGQAEKRTRAYQADRASLPRPGALTAASLGDSHQPRLCERGRSTSAT